MRRTRSSHRAARRASRRSRGRELGRPGPKLMPGSDIRAIAEAELVLLGLARSQEACQTCMDRPRVGYAINGVPNADAQPCDACGWTPRIEDIEVVFGDHPSLLWMP